MTIEIYIKNVFQNAMPVFKEYETIIQKCDQIHVLVKNSYMIEFVIFCFKINF
jgi:hypothetical protein